MAIIGSNNSSGTKVTLTSADTNGYTETGSSKFTLVENSANISRSDNAVTSSGMQINGDGFSVVVMNEGGVFGAGGRGAGQPGNSSTNGEAGAPAFTAATGTKVFNWPGGTITGGGGGGGKGGTGDSSPGGTSPAGSTTPSYYEYQAQDEQAMGGCFNLQTQFSGGRTVGGEQLGFFGSSTASFIPTPSESFPEITSQGANSGIPYCIYTYGARVRGRGTGWFADGFGRRGTCAFHQGRRQLVASNANYTCRLSRLVPATPGCPGTAYGTVSGGGGAPGGNGASLGVSAGGGGQGNEGSSGNSIGENNCGGGSNPAPAFSQTPAGAGGDGGNGGALGSSGVGGFAGYTAGNPSNPGGGGAHGGSASAGGSAGAGGGRITGGGSIIDL